MWCLGSLQARQKAKAEREETRQTQHGITGRQAYIEKVSGYRTERAMKGEEREVLRHTQSNPTKPSKKAQEACCLNRMEKICTKCKLLFFLLGKAKMQCYTQRKRHAKRKQSTATEKHTAKTGKGTRQKVPFPLSLPSLSFLPASVSPCSF